MSALNLRLAVLFQLVLSWAPIAAENQGAVTQSPALKAIAESYDNNTNTTSAISNLLAIEARSPADARYLLLLRLADLSARPDMGAFLAKLYSTLREHQLPDEIDYGRAAFALRTNGLEAVFHCLVHSPQQSDLWSAKLQSLAPTHPLPHYVAALASSQTNEALFIHELATGNLAGPLIVYGLPQLLKREYSEAFSAEQMRAMNDESHVFGNSRFLSTMASSLQVALRRSVLLTQQEQAVLATGLFQKLLDCDTSDSPLTLLAAMQLARNTAQLQNTAFLQNANQLHNFQSQASQLSSNLISNVRSKTNRIEVAALIKTIVTNSVVTAENAELLKKY